MVLFARRVNQHETTQSASLSPGHRIRLSHSLSELDQRFLGFQELVHILINLLPLALQLVDPLHPLIVFLDELPSV